MPLPPQGLGSNFLPLGIPTALYLPLPHGIYQDLPGTTIWSVTPLPLFLRAKPHLIPLIGPVTSQNRALLKRSIQ